MMLEILLAYLLFSTFRPVGKFSSTVLCQETGAVYLVFVLFTIWTERSRTDLPTVASSLSPWRGKCRKQTITCRNKCLKECTIPFGLPQNILGPVGLDPKFTSFSSFNVMRVRPQGLQATSLVSTRGELGNGRVAAWRCAVHSCVLAPRRWRSSHLYIRDCQIFSSKSTVSFGISLEFYGMFPCIKVSF